ncbi:MAG: FAD-binding dehydrogenase [Acidobacteria bacterium]|nr:FAD-binding dehydrogenase [Acidobacteriota bacterium]
MTEAKLTHRADVVFVGGGVSALWAALELVEAGRRVVILEAGGPERLGGQARDAFGGFCFVGSPEQRRAGVRDNAELAWQDWQGYAEFGPDSELAQLWARRYVERNLPDVREALVRRGHSFFPLPAWAERAHGGRGNRLPRFHLLWGCGAGLVGRLLTWLRPHMGDRLTLACHHRVEGLLWQGGRVVGVSGVQGDSKGDFEAHGEQMVIASGGFNGDLDLVRGRWPAEWGAAPRELLNGSYPWIDGRMQTAATELGAATGPLDQMWVYAAGIAHWKGAFPGHGLAVIPPRSALWLRADGARFSPPLLAGTDTRDLVGRIAATGQPWSWLLLNRRILAKELALQGSEFNPAFREHRWLRLVSNLLLGNGALADEVLAQAPDALSAPDLPTLVARMNALAPEGTVDAGSLRSAVEAWDEELARGPRFHTDPQLQYLRSVRAFPGDRLRTLAHQPILEPAAGPLVALRLRLLSRKSLGGLRTRLDGSVVDAAGEPLPGLYALGEAAGFGGGGMNGKRTLEGTLLGGCILGAGQFASATLTGHLPSE